MATVGADSLAVDRISRSKAQGHLARAMERLLRKKIAVACIVTLVLLYTGGIFAEWISPYGYSDLDYTALQGQPPSASHWAGTDLLGRDILTRVLWGIQNTVILTVVSIVIAGPVIGVSLGLFSGYFGGKIDSLVMRVGELFAAFPEVLLVIIIAATLRPRFITWARWAEDNWGLDGVVRSGVVDYVVVSVALVSFGWIGMARLVRGQVLSLKEMQYAEAARALGASTSRILFVHMLPNAISPIVVTMTMGMGTMVGTEIFLSWLGLGIQPPRPSLGILLLEGGSLTVLKVKPWLLLAPGLAAWTLVLAWNLLGDALNDVLNPRTR